MEDDMFLKKGELPPSEFFAFRSRHLRMTTEEHLKGILAIYFVFIIVTSALFHISESVNQVWVLMLICHSAFVVYQRQRWKYLFGDWKGELHQLELPLQLPAKVAAP